MPKKTKKEKLLAQQHRKSPTREQSVLSTSFVPQPAPVANTTISYNLQPIAPHQSKPAISRADEITIKRDLVKTILWSFVIIVSELLLARYI